MLLLIALILFTQAVFSYKLTLLNSINDPPIWNKTILPFYSVLRDGKESFKLYYSGADYLEYNLATSANGKTGWTDYAKNPMMNGTLEHVMVLNQKYYETAFPGLNDGYYPNASYMYYRFWNYLYYDMFCYAESPDGINWYNIKPLVQYPPLIREAEENCEVIVPWNDVIYTPDATNTGTDWTFRMYISRFCWATPLLMRNSNKIKFARDFKSFRSNVIRDVVLSCNEANTSIFLAFSRNGYNWTGYSAGNTGFMTPVFTPLCKNITTNFDDCNIVSMHVIKNSPTDWEAFYTGASCLTAYYGFLENGIGYATSTDGIEWKRSSQNPLIVPVHGLSWHNTSTMIESVVKLSPDHYFIYFTGSDFTEVEGWKLGLLEYISDFPITFSKHHVLLFSILGGEGVIVIALVPVLLVYLFGSPAAAKQD